MALNISVQTEPFFIKLENTLHTATPAEWSQLQSALTTTSSTENLNLTVYLNEGGEYSYYDYQTLLDMIGRGGVWIDWTGWPFAVTNLTTFTPGLPGWEYNFQNFAVSTGLALGYNGGPAEFASVPPGWPYVRSLVSSIPITSKNFMVNPYAKHETYGNDHVYSSFAIRYQKGAYIYAFANNVPYNLLNPSAINTSAGVPFSEYWPFIESVLKDIGTYPSTSSAAPDCTSTLGEYRGTNANGEYIYVLTSGDKTTTTVSLGSCTPLSQTVTSSTSGSVTGQVYGSATSSSTACPKLGAYLGDGSVVGANPKYNAYVAYFSGYYEYRLALPGSCNALFTYKHTSTPPAVNKGVPGAGTPVTSGGSGSGGKTSPTPSGGGGGSTTAPNSAGLPSFLTTQNALLIGGGLVAAGLGYYLYKRRG